MSLSNKSFQSVICILSLVVHCYFHWKHSYSTCVINLSYLRNKRVNTHVRHRLNLIFNINLIVFLIVHSHAPALSINTFSNILNKSIIILLSASTIASVSRRFSNSRLTSAIAGIENGGLINLRIAAAARALRVTRHS